MHIQEILFMSFSLMLLSASALAVTKEASGHGMPIAHHAYLMNGKAPQPEIIPASRPESQIPPQLLNELSRYRIEEILPPADVPKIVRNKR
jgi:hypothetical protein